MDGEAALVARLARGDAAAIEALYDRLAAPAYGLALRIARDPRLAEDAVQEAMTRVWSRARQYDPRAGSARAWVLRIVRNAAIDQLRTETSRERAAAGAAALPPEEPTRAEQPDALVAGAQQAAHLRAALAALPVEQRRTIEICYFEGLSHAEIAAREGVPLGTVKTRIRDGLLRLRRFAAEGRLDG
jgi:RNA polymerase sigma-70 factor (ECF subfamily)